MNSLAILIYASGNYLPFRARNLHQWNQWKSGIRGIWKSKFWCGENKAIQKRWSVWWWNGIWKFGRGEFLSQEMIEHYQVIKCNYWDGCRWRHSTFPSIFSFQFLHFRHFFFHLSFHFFPSLLSLSLIRCHLLLLLLPLLLLLLLFQIDMAKGANFKHIVLKKERVREREREREGRKKEEVKKTEREGRSYIRVHLWRHRHFRMNWSAVRIIQHPYSVLQLDIDSPELIRSWFFSLTSLSLSLSIYLSFFLFPNKLIWISCIHHLEINRNWLNSKGQVGERQSVVTLHHISLTDHNSID